jgi:hypothetical protein
MSIYYAYLDCFIVLYLAEYYMFGNAVLDYFGYIYVPCRFYSLQSERTVLYGSLS